METHHSHAIIWIDHREARIFHFNLSDVERLVIHPDNPTRHIHHKANTMGSGNTPEDLGYFKSVSEAVAGAHAVLITGPANEKTEFMKYVRERIPALAKAVAGVETVDHPSDPQLVAFARKYFSAADLMRPQIG